MFSYSKTLELIANSLIKEEKQDPVVDKKTKKELKKQQKNDKLRIIMDNLRYCHKCLKQRVPRKWFGRYRISCLCTEV